MKEHSRTTNTIYNFTTSMGGQLITIVMHFAVRTVFVHTLGKSYLGIGGLFSNILTMLSLAEFGVGSAIIFKLYKPIAEHDYHRIAVLMKFYKVVYRLIGMAVALIGIILIPFLPSLIKDYDKLISLHINAEFIFLLYLLKSVSSYLFFAYKSSIVKANQKEYLLNLITYIFTIVASVLQILSLLIWPNFTLYVLIMIIQIIGQNLACAVLSDKMYPYINEKNTERLSGEEIKEIIKDCAALFLYKLNGVVLKATDNLVLSVFIGLDAVAEYSNYYILYTTINTLFAKIYNSVSHSLGNLNAKESKEKKYQVFESTVLITAILGGTAGVGIFVVADELIDTWIGFDWVLKQPFSLIMGLEVFTLAFRICLSKFRTTMGLFQQAKWRPLAGMIINLIISILLVRKWGIVGVLIGTVVADWSTTMWFDPIIIHKYGYNNQKEVSVYFIKLFKYLVVCGLIGGLDYYICSHFLTGAGWISVFVHAIICGISVPAALVIGSIRYPEGRYVFSLMLRVIKDFYNKLTKKIIKKY